MRKIIIFASSIIFFCSAQIHAGDSKGQRVVSGNTDKPLPTRPVFWDQKQKLGQALGKKGRGGMAEQQIDPKLKPKFIEPEITR